MNAPVKTKALTDTMLIIGPVRFSYLKVFRPELNKLRKEEEYSVTLLVPKAPVPECPNPGAILKAVREACDAALIAEFKEVPKKYSPRLLDGDVETDGEGVAKAPGYWIIATRADVQHPPILLDQKRAPVIDGKEWVSGDWGYAKVAFYGYTFENAKGVGGGIRAIQFAFKGEPLGDSQSLASVQGEFDDVEEDFLS